MINIRQWVCLSIESCKSEERSSRLLMDGIFTKYGHKKTPGKNQIHREPFSAYRYALILFA